mgnify:CR=1 FL=1
MAEFQEILDFPPAPKLDVFGKLDPGRRRRPSCAGRAVFFGKGSCATCHVPPYYTDNLMHNLQAERFFKPVMINGMMAIGDGPIKTFPLRGIKDSPPYLHDGRLLTLDDTVEFFNLVLGTQLTDRGEEGPRRVPHGALTPARTTQPNGMLRRWRGGEHGSFWLGLIAALALLGGLARASR